MFPQDLLENGPIAASNFAMLGLGDIVIPGIFVALLLRFDVRSVEKGAQWKSTRPLLSQRSEVQGPINGSPHKNSPDLQKPPNRMKLATWCSL